MLSYNQPYNIPAAFLFVDALQLGPELKHWADAVSSIMHFKIGPLWEKNRIPTTTNVGAHDIDLITVIAWRYLSLGASANQRSPCFNYLSIEPGAW